jgi:hypothetical protein
MKMGVGSTRFELAQDEMSGHMDIPDALLPRETHHIRQIGGLKEPRANTDIMVKNPCSYR